MNKQAFDMGFVKACSHYGITDQNQVNELYKQALSMEDILRNPYYLGAAGAGLGGLTGYGASQFLNIDPLTSALVGAGLGGVAGAGTAYMHPDNVYTRDYNSAREKAISILGSNASNSEISKLTQQLFSNPNTPIRSVGGRSG